MKHPALPFATTLACCVCIATGRDPAPNPATNGFALALHRGIASADGNIFHSPYSIAATLAMALEGARGETAKQMAAVLHCDPSGEKLRASYGGLRTSAADGVFLETANALWRSPGSPFLPEYVDLCKNSYGAEATVLDFSDPSKACETINQWFRERTKGKITHVVNPSPLTPMTCLVLANAIYFRGKWNTAFNPALTKTEPFDLGNGKRVRAPLMRKLLSIRYAEDAGVRMVELPYRGEEYSMLVVLPPKADGLAALEQSLDAATLPRWLSKLGYEQVAVAFPKFKTGSTLELSRMLAKMGMTGAFTQDAADFSGMDGKRDLWLGLVDHKAVLEVDEEGVTAAAGTAAEMPFGPEPDPKPSKTVYFRADRPFLYLIRCHKTGDILFMGRMADPTVP